MYARSSAKRVTCMISFNPYNERLEIGAIKIFIFQMRSTQADSVNCPKSELTNGRAKNSESDSRTCAFSHHVLYTNVGE